MYDRTLKNIAKTYLKMITESDDFKPMQKHADDTRKAPSSTKNKGDENNRKSETIGEVNARLKAAQAKRVASGESNTTIRLGKNQTTPKGRIGHRSFRSVESARDDLRSRFKKAAKERAKRMKKESVELNSSNI